MIGWSQIHQGKLGGGGARAESGLIGSKEAKANKK